MKHSKINVYSYLFKCIELLVGGYFMISTSGEWWPRESSKRKHTAAANIGLIRT